MCILYPYDDMRVMPCVMPFVKHMIIILGLVQTIKLTRFSIDVEGCEKLSWHAESVASDVSFFQTHLWNRMCH